MPQAAVPQAEHGEYEEGKGPGHLQIGGTLKRGRDHGEGDEEPEEGEEEGRAWTRTRRSDSGDDVDTGVSPVCLCELIARAAVPMILYSSVSCAIWVGMWVWPWV